MVATLIEIENGTVQAFEHTMKGLSKKLYSSVDFATSNPETLFNPKLKNDRKQPSSFDYRQSNRLQ